MILIYTLATGAKVADNLPSLPAGFDKTKQGWREQPIGYPDRIAWQQSLPGFVDTDTTASVEADLVARVKSEGEQRRMLVMSPGGSKKTVYSLKQSEVDAWNDLGSTVATMLTTFLGMAAVKQKRKFRFAMAEAALRGEANPAAAIARFAAGSDAANAEAARIEAIEQAGVAAIKAATTIAAKRTAYAAINWDWKP